MVISYDQEARSRELFIDEAKEKEKAEKKQVAEKVAALNAELESANKSSNDIFKHLQSVTAEKKKDEAKIAELEKELSALKSSREVELSALKSSHEREIEDAVAVARRTATAEVQTQLHRAYEYFIEMMGKPMTNLLHYSQAISNLQILEDMEDPEEAFDPVTERDNIKEMKAELGCADDIFDEMVEKLKKMLGKNYELSIDLGDLVFSPRLETIAKSVGVFVASGSNDGSLGLRLREDCEETGHESDGGEADKVDEAAAREEVALVEPRVELAPTDPIVEKPLGESASSTVPAANQEKDKEDGEL